MRRAVLALTLAATAFLAVAAERAHAVFSPFAFTPLRVELEHRAANDFTGSLKGAQKKQKRAVAKGLKLLDKKSTSIAKDASTGKKLGKLLGKAFKDEFVTAQPMKQADLGPMFQQMVENLANTLRNDIGSLVVASDRVGDEKARGKIVKQIEKANAALDEAAVVTKLGKRFAKIKAAAVGTAKARKLLEKALGSGGDAGDRTLATVDGADWRSLFSQSEYYQGDMTLQIFASRSVPDGSTEEIVLVVTGVTGPGTYPLSSLNARGSFNVLSPTFEFTVFDLVPDSGSLVVETLELDPPHIKATFSFDALNPMDGTKMIRDGDHDVMTDVSVIPDAGF